MPDTKNTPIPMSSPDLTQAEIDAISQVVSTRHLSIGPKIDAFERVLADYVGTAHATGVNSGTSGLHLTVIAAGITDDHLVITSPFSFVASANCILYERAIPIFVDVDPKTGNLDPTQVAQAAHDLTHNTDAARHWLPPALRDSPALPQTLKAILPVHAFGQPADMDPINATAQTHNLAVIEDACEAIGAQYKGRMAGTLGDAGVFAFYPNKQITTGEGGMIVTNHPHWNDLFRSLRNQGRDIFNAWLNHSRLGYNYRLDEMSAAIGLVQMQRIDELFAKRAQVAQWYNQRLSGVECLETPFIAPTTTCMSWFVYVVRIKPPANRNQIMQQLAQTGIPSRPYFTPIHLQTFYQEKFGYRRGDFPITETLGDTSLALPFSSIMNEEQVDYVCEHLIRLVQPT